MNTGKAFAIRTDSLHSLQIIYPLTPVNPNKENGFKDYFDDAKPFFFTCSSRIDGHLNACSTVMSDLLDPSGSVFTNLKSHVEHAVMNLARCALENF